jgi:CBS domain containing-hemolysin-like protein
MMQMGLEFTRVAVNDVAHAIQLSLGPVFLLNGIGVLLAMLTSRLARVVDRARALELRLPAAAEAETGEITRVLKLTSRRGRLINRAITLGTIAALLVATVVALLFAAAFIAFPFGSSIALLFVLSMAALVGSLTCFLIEVRMATAALRFGPPRA